MELDDKTLTRLAEKIASCIKTRNELVSMSEVAEMCGYSKTNPTFREAVSKDPDFPKGIALTDSGYLKYRRSDVSAWIDRKFKQA